MREVIELHDSDLLGIRREGAALVVDLNAYLHRSEGEPGVDAGTGWIQRAEIRLEDASTPSLPDAPFEIFDGSLDMDDTHFSNCLPLPFDRAGEIRLVLSRLGGEHVTIRATAAAVRLIGEPTYVEDFPGSK